MKSRASKPIPIELNEVHEMVKNLADSIAVNYTDAKKAPFLKEKLLTELKDGNFNQFTKKQATASHLSKVLRTWSNVAVELPYSLCAFIRIWGGLGFCFCF